MPIRPENRALYGPDWRQWSAWRRGEAGGQCECRGECGAHPHPADESGRCAARYRQPHPVTGSDVVLTVAHLNHDPADRRPEVTRAMCQRCHLTYDGPHHAATRARTRAAQQAAGRGGEAGEQQ